MTQTQQDLTLHPLAPDTPASDNGTEPPSPPTRRRRLPSRKWWIGGGLAVAAVAGVAALGGDSDSAAQSDTTAGPVNTAEVVVADLVQEVTFAGTLGTVAGDPITASAPGVVTDVAAAGTTAAEADVLYRIDNEPVVLLYGDTPAYRNITLGSDTMAVTTANAGVVTAIAPAGTIIEQALAEFGFTRDGSLEIDGEFTYDTRLAVQDWQEARLLEVDGSVDVGEVVFIPGPSQVVDLGVSVGDSINPGTEIMALSTGDAMSGDDVAQLEASLAGQGFDADGDLAVDGVFTAETRQAIVEWQTAVGQDPDGVINLGDVVFLPGSVRVADQLASTGATINVGAPVLAISSADKVVRVDVPAAEQGLVEIGDSVTVVLPGFEEAPGTIVSISTTATVDQDGETLFEATVELDDPAAASGLDEAPVDVNVAGDSATGVTAVPVTALVALSGGGYAVEVQTTTGGYQLVAVEPGFFADGLVAITSDSLSAGDIVTLP